nr:PREDICTED: F-box/kelch-repeat protein At3g06240-like isoform X1 [Nicotiana tabacum]
MCDETASLGSCTLPGDAMVEILLRLPVKSLLRFRAVSKSWYGFLSSPDFIQMHLRHGQQPLHEKLLRVSDRGPRDTPTISFFSVDRTVTVNADDDIDDGVDVYKNNNDLYPSSVVDLPFPSSPDDEVRIVGSCNGLLCVHFNRTSNIILWNPATSKYRFLESPDNSVSFYCDPFFPYIMLGFVPETDDFKVVKVPSSSRKHNIDAKVWVYTLSSDSWEEMGAVNLLPKGGSAVNLNGCLYWMSYNNSDNGRDIVTSFDLYKQVFGQIMVPNSESITDFTVKKLVVLNGCLSMIIYSENGLNVDHYEVWMMNEQQGVSWTKRVDFSLFSKLARPVGSWRDSEILFGYPNGLSHELLSYNPFTKRAQSFQRRSSVGGFKVINYVESLESVEGS